MDQSLKERLIGAAVLVLLGVWLIPWLLDGRQEQAVPGSSTSALRLPAPDGPLPVRSQTLALDAPREDPFVAEAPRADSAPATPAAAPDASAVAASNAPPSTPPSPASASERSVPAPSAAKPTGAPVAGQRVATAPAKPAEPAPAHAAPPKADASGGWAVQLGVFSAEDNARRLAQKVNVYGYKPTVASYKSSGRAMYRVRLGPYSSRSEADATASALSAHGFAAQVATAD